MLIVNSRNETTIQQTNPGKVTDDQQTEPQPPPAPALSHKTPQEFYAEVTKRADVRAVMEELAIG